MKTKVEYSNNILKLKIENDKIHEQQIKEAFYVQEEDEYLVKTFEGDFKYIDKIKKNFVNLVPKMFDESDWQNALLQVAKYCKENDIIWYITGSACDAVRGIKIVPHDLDIEIYSEHWDKAQEAFKEFMIEPFIKTEGWARDTFGRLVICNTQIDMVSDKRFDLPTYDYEPYMWNGFTLWLEPFMKRYRTEIDRKREDRISAFSDFFTERGIKTQRSFE